MHAYVDAMEFSEMEFDSAIRTFLQGFRWVGAKSLWGLDGRAAQWH